MTNCVILTPVFRTVLLLGLIADLGSKWLVNLLAETHQAGDQLQGKVWPYPPGHVSITHAENVQEHWYDVTGGILGYAYELVDRITPIDILPEWFILGVVVGIPLMFSLPSIWQKRPQIVLSVGLALWFAALIGNKGEIWLFGHVTDWIWVNYGSFGKITNLADVMILVVFVLVLVTLRSKDNRKPRGDLPNTGVT